MCVRTSKNWWGKAIIRHFLESELVSPCNNYQLEIWRALLNASLNLLFKMELCVTTCWAAAPHTRTHKHLLPQQQQQSLTSSSITPNLCLCSNFSKRQRERLMNLIRVTINCLSFYLSVTKRETSTASKKKHKNMKKNKNKKMMTKKK